MSEILFVIIGIFIVGSPFLLIGIIVVQLARKKRLRGATIAALIGATLFLGGWRYFFPSETRSPFRVALPKRVIETSEWYFSDGFLPDYAYYLRAKISPEDFDKYVKYFSLTPHSVDRKYEGGFSAGPAWVSGPADWWNPSASTLTTFAKQDALDSWTYAKYENGYLYLHSFTH
jgi:hypothetical protein